MKKLKVFLVTLGIIVIIVAIDLIKLSTVEIKLNKITPEIAEGISTKPVEIIICVKDKSGKGLSDHNLYALTLGGGSWESYYSKTDENGNAKFIFYPYDLPEYQQPRDIEVQIRDESNSIFIEMYPTLTFNIKIKKADKADSQKGTIDDFLS
jgi:hypothetical protein